MTYQTRTLIGAVIWCAGWLLMGLLDGYFDITNLGMLFVLTSSLASVFFSLRLAVLFSVIFILAFDWLFISPRGTLVIDVRQQAFTLAVMFVINLIIAVLVSIQRTQSERAARHAKEAERLREWGDRLQQSLDPFELVDALQLMLSQLSDRPVALLILKTDAAEQKHQATFQFVGAVDIEQQHALWYSVQHCQQLGRGSGRFELFSDVYLPLRANSRAVGAALLGDFAVHELSTRIHLQAICDQFGHAVERFWLHQQELVSRERAQEQLVRNNILAAISHDYRTPLATIMGAASSLTEQSEKIDGDYSRHLARRIYDEAERLNSLTSNILQLARLDAGNSLQCDWQSPEDIVGDLRRRWRERPQAERLQIHMTLPLPLIWCDPLLIGQLLENLVDNAMKYSQKDSVVGVSVSLEPGVFIFSVMNSGAPIPLAWRETIFQPFQRGPVTDVSGVAGSGVGLALCRAIARAHDGELLLNDADLGITRFDLHLPRRELPH